MITKSEHIKSVEEDQKAFYEAFSLIRIDDIDEFPINGFHHDIQNIIKDISNKRLVPYEIVVAPILAGASIAIGNKARVINEYTNNLSEWLMIVAPSGSNKSQPIKDILEPITRISSDLHKQYTEEQKKYNKIQEKETSTPPKYKTLTIKDTTPESRYQALADNEHGILLVRDELAGMIGDLGRYSKSGELEQMLSIFDGDDLQVMRKTQEPLYVENPYLSIIGGIQPGVLKDTFNGSQFTSSGFLPRFLMFYPQDIEFANRNRIPLNEVFINKWHKVINTLYDNTLIPYGTEITLSDEADEEYTKFFNSVAYLLSILEDDYKRSVWSKLRIHVLRLAGLCHVLNIACGEPLSPIPIDTMKWAISTAKYFANTQNKVYEIIGKNTQKLSRNQVFTQLLEWYPEANKSSIAKSLGITRQTLQGFLRV